MATRIQFDFPTVSNPAFRGISCDGPIARFRAVIVRWRQRRALEMLDERMLHDIGISRSQALAEARKPFWRR